MTYSRASGVVVLWALFVLASCGGDNGDTASAEERAATEAGLLAQVSSLEAPDALEAVEDGVVTRSELETVALNMVSCADREGIEVLLQDDDNSGGFKYGYPADSEQTVERCAAEEGFTLLSAIWAMDAGPSEAEQEKIHDTTVKCLADAGFDVPEWPDLQGVVVDPSIEADCYDDARDSVVE